MFGIFRYVLALLVVISHLSPKPTSNAPGTYAVFGFYILSGYLMTLILNKTYKFSLDGLKRFLINRFLRIYPTYWIVAIASIGIIFLIPNITQSLNKALVLPTSSLNSIYNIVLIGLTQSTASRLVPPAWALSVELSFYILMAIALVRNRLITTIWFIGSLVYTLYMIANNYSIESRYFPLQAASLPFSTGAVIYFFRFQYAPKFATTSLSTINWRFWIVTFLFVANALYGSSVIEPNTVGFYFSYFLGFYLVFYLASVDVKKLPNWLRKTDTLLGGLSYPIYLCHWQIAALTVWLFFGTEQPLGNRLFFTSLFPIHLVGYLRLSSSR